MTVSGAVGALFIAAGLFFLIVGAIGLLRLPDFYTRLHATGKTDTFGAVLFMIGVVIINGLDLVGVKVLIVAGFILIGNPTATHAISRAALKAGLRPWSRRGEDE